MDYRYLNLTALTASLLTTSLSVGAVPWTTVVNNNDYAPGSVQQKFYSYNQPSINAQGLVVFRARAKNPTSGSEGADNVATAEGGGPIRGVFSRDMVYLTPMATIASTQSPYNEVPAPNNIIHPGKAVFNEFPSFPRIDKSSATAAFRGQSSPSWEVPDIGKVGGTSGLYTGLAGDLRTGIRNIEPSYFNEYLVPGNALPHGASPTRFDQFPGAPSPTANLVVFKGNYTTSSGPKTGVFYRKAPGKSASNTVQMIANSETTCIPGTNPCVRFGSTAPPSAADKKVVFVGLDYEDNPTLGGIYLRDLKDANPKYSPAPLAPLAEIGKTKIPGYDGQPLDNVSTFARFGEALSFDGRYVAFWGAWGHDTKKVKLVCPDEGNKAVIQYCHDHENNKEVDVPLHQGIFVHDTQSGMTKMAAQSESRDDDFIYWNFSGRPPGVGDGHDGDESVDEVEDYEEPRWRSTAFVAVDGERVVYKARSGILNDSGLWSAPVDGIYLKNTVGNGVSPVATLVDTTMPGGVVDPAASGSTISAIGIERDGFRSGWLAINASMVVSGDEAETSGWAGIYLTRP